MKDALYLESHSYCTYDSSTIILLLNIKNDGSRKNLNKK